MKARLQPLLPGRAGIGGLREESAGRVEEPGAGFQLFTTLTAAALVRRNRKRLGPLRLQFPAQAFGAFRDQRGHRRPLPVPIHAAQGSRAQPTQPAVQAGRIGMPSAHGPDGLPQTAARLRRGEVRRARRLDHRPRVALVRRDLHWQDAETLPAGRADALRHWRLAILDTPTPRPPRAPRPPSAGKHQRAHGATARTGNSRADRFAFDGRGPQGIIRNGDGNWDSTLSGSPRGTGALTPVPHFFQKARTLSPQRARRKQLVHNRALMSMSFSSFSSGNPGLMRSGRPWCDKLRLVTEQQTTPRKGVRYGSE